MTPETHEDGACRHLPDYRDLAIANIRLALGLPLPVDLTARLLEQGFDVQAIEDAHSN